MSRLKAIFDECSWSNKVEGSLPQGEEVLYSWHERQSAFAESFFGNSGRQLLTEEDSVVTRTLWYAMDEKGRPTLVVTQKEKKIDVEQAAKDFAELMNPEKVQESLERVMGYRYKKP